jgi:hypothetical protein
MAYTQAQAVIDTRRHLKDTTQNIWTDDDIKQFINDAIALIRQAVPLYFTNLQAVPYEVDGVKHSTINIDSDYEMLIPLFAAARCFEQDEQHYRAVQKMNEFESRLVVMVTNIMESDAYADLLARQEEEGILRTDAIKDVYFKRTNNSSLPVGLL